jgi:hypothetical protein
MAQALSTIIEASVVGFEVVENGEKDGKFKK